MRAPVAGGARGNESKAQLIRQAAGGVQRAADGCVQIVPSRYVLIPLVVIKAPFYGAHIEPISVAVRVQFVRVGVSQGQAKWLR